MMPSATGTPAGALRSATLLSPLALSLVVGVVVGAVVGVVGGRRAVSSRRALARPLFAAVSVVVLALFAVPVVLDVLLFRGGEEAAGYLLEELVGNLLSAVAERLECQDRHGSDGAQGLKSGCGDRAGDVWRDRSAAL